MVLPLGTREALLAPAVRRLSEQYDVLTWESRLVLTPEVAMSGPEDLAIARQVEDAQAVLDHFGVRSAFLLGYCSGAAAALHVAAALEERITRLALVNGAYFLPSGVCERTRYEQDVQALIPMIASDLRQAAFVFTGVSKSRSARCPHPEFGEELRLPYASAQSLYRFGVGLNGFIQCDSREAARRIAIPALVATGKGDDQAHPASSAVIAAVLGRSELHVDEAGDHYALCRASPALIWKIDQFFTDGERGPRRSQA
jgi:pimeloyl-ACP methyl ester carboxylesterase